MHPPCTQTSLYVLSSSFPPSVITHRYFYVFHPSMYAHSWRQKDWLSGESLQRTSAASLHRLWTSWMEMIGWMIHPYTSGVKLKHWRICINLSEDTGTSVQASSAVHVSCVLQKQLSLHPLTRRGSNSSDDVEHRFWCKLYKPTRADVPDPRKRRLKRLQES